VVDKNIKEYFLITTALEESWPENKRQPILFLGEWCRIYSRKNLWEKMDVDVLPYHWDNRRKLYKDYLYLAELSERVLVQLSAKLNYIHNVDYSLRYWRILVGPWLITFLPMIFDRWSCVRNALKTYTISGTRVFQGYGENEFNLINIPQSMADFSSLAKTDLWNHNIFQMILHDMNFNKIETMSFATCHDDRAEVNSVLSWNKIIKSKIIKEIRSLSRFFAKNNNNNYFIINPYLSTVDLVKLQLKLGQFPVFYQGEEYANSDTPDLLRRTGLLDIETKNDFEVFINKIIPLQMPLSYLEGYKNLNYQSKALNWPSEPKLIWTSNSFYIDDIFKIWSAKLVENKVPLVIGQHGGLYGQGLFNMLESHELNICDYYFSWGWTSNNSKVIPIGITKKSLINKKKSNKRKYLSLIVGLGSRYSGGIASLPVAGQWKEYFDDQLMLYNNLDEKVSKSMRVKLYPHDYNWSQYERWKDFSPRINIARKDKSLNEQLMETKILVYGCNTTVYLESMVSDIPTVIFWRSKYFELRDDVKADFDKLASVGIFHNNPESAAEHINAIWSNVNSWWKRQDVVLAKEEFIQKFANSNNIVGRISEVIKEISTKGEAGI